MVQATAAEEESSSSYQAAKVRELEARVAALEAQGPGLLRVRRHCVAAGVGSAVYKWVPADYYDRPMAARAVRWFVCICGSSIDSIEIVWMPNTPLTSHTQELLGCFEEQMCKALLMENVDWQPLPPQLDMAEGSDLGRRVNSRYARACLHACFAA